uniref:TRP_2 domain-containing protein n=1 Tax=Macrostomum lignano TaxID=282301 RepID=A0A1I8FEU2_9PLAT
MEKVLARLQASAVRKGNAEEGRRRCGGRRRRHRFRPHNGGVADHRAVGNRFGGGGRRRGGGGGGNAALRLGCGAPRGRLLRKDFDLNMKRARYLQAVELGDLATVRRSSHQHQTARDSLGRSALHVRHRIRHIELLEVLLAYNLELGDALLHAIQEENIIAVEMLLSSQTERQKKEGLIRPPRHNTVQQFHADVAPIIAGPPRSDNYESSRAAAGPRRPRTQPHELGFALASTGVRRHKEAQFCQHSKSRINAYKALASPSLIALLARIRF